MKEYLTKFIGVPEENTITLTNDGATKAEIDVLIKDRLRGLLKEGDTPAILGERVNMFK